MLEGEVEPAQFRAPFAILHNRHCDAGGILHHLWLLQVGVRVAADDGVDAGDLPCQ